VAGSVESPELVGTLALRLPDVRCKAMPSEVVQCVPAATVVLFFFAPRLEARAFRKAMSFLWCMKDSLQALAAERLAGCLVRAIESTHQELTVKIDQSAPMNTMQNQQSISNQ
jgi:hypothetical protein